MASAHVVVGDLSPAGLSPAGLSPAGLSPAWLSLSLSLSDEDAHHLGTVLRLRPGASVTATDGRGGLVACRYVGGAALEVVEEPTFLPPPSPPVTVGFAPVKGDRPEWAVQKLTEVGVDRIILLQTSRGVVRWEGARAASHLERLRKVAREAVMQSRRRWVPAVEGVSSLSSLAAPAPAPAVGSSSLPSPSSSPSSSSLVGGRSSPAGGSASAGPGVALAVSGGPPPNLSFPTVLVGPEGGWDPSELSLVDARVGLGPAIMRTETAAVAAGVLLVGLRSGVVNPA